MIVVERHYIDRQHQFFQQFDDLSLLSKNLYNHANYWMRQHFFKSGSSVGAGLNLKQLYAIVKPTSDYKSLLNMIRKVSGNSLFSACSNRLEVFAVSPIRVYPVQKNAKSPVISTIARFFVNCEKVEMQKVPCIKGYSPFSDHDRI